jgi:ankyrin repeat protein
MDTSQAVQMLIEHNADIHIRTKLGESPLHVAASPFEKHLLVDIMQVLLDHGQILMHGMTMVLPHCILHHLVGSEAYAQWDG